MELCPCGFGEQYAQCCGRFHLGEAAAPTAVQLMRSRYSAFVVHDADYLLRTWHPSTRPPSLDFDDDTEWVRLTILGSAGGGLLDTEGTVEFVAQYRTPAGRGRQQELSSFSRVGGLWVYVDAIG